jgi:PAS domain S-box-containing protein
MPFQAHVNLDYYRLLDFHRRVIVRRSGGFVSMREKECFDTLCNTEDGVFIVDAEKRILRWNKGAEKILGHAEKDVLNRECFTVVTGRSRADKILCGQNCKIHSNALNGTPQDNFDMLVQGKDKKPLWINVSVLSPSNGGEPFLAHIVRDVTQAKTKGMALEQFLAYLDVSGLLSKEIPGAKPVPRKTSAAIQPAADKAVAPLSEREIEVLTLLAEGFSTKNLAQKLNISHFTARNHIQNILVKLNLHSKAQAVSYAFKKGIL